MNMSLPDGALETPKVFITTHPPCQISDMEVLDIRVEMGAAAAIQFTLFSKDCSCVGFSMIKFRTSSEDRKIAFFSSANCLPCYNQITNKNYKDI